MAKVIPIRSKTRQEVVALAFAYWRERFSLGDSSPKDDLLRAHREVTHRRSAKLFIMRRSSRNALEERIKSIVTSLQVTNKPHTRTKLLDELGAATRELVKLLKEGQLRRVSHEPLPQSSRS